MARRKSNHPPPEWFDITKYQCDDLDHADWFLNLWARLWIRRGAPSRHVGGQLNASIQALRTAPIIRRLLLDDTHLIFSIAVDDPDFSALLANSRPPSSVRSLTVSSLYYFEQLLPASTRMFASTLPKDGDPPALSPHQRPSPPSGFLGAVDDALPDQYVARFARIDLAHSDEVLVQDLLTFVASERERLRKIAPDAPFLESLEQKHHTDVFKTWCSWQILAVIDLEYWFLESGQAANWSTIDQWITDNPSATGDDTRKAAKLIRKTLSNDLALRNFLLPLARKVVR